MLFGLVILIYGGNSSFYQYQFSALAVLFQPFGGMD